MELRDATRRAKKHHVGKHNHLRHPAKNHIQQKSFYFSQSHPNDSANLFHTDTLHYNPAGRGHHSSIIIAFLHPVSTVADFQVRQRGYGQMVEERRKVKGRDKVVGSGRGYFETPKMVQMTIREPGRSTMVLGERKRMEPLRATDSTMGILSRTSRASISYGPKTEKMTLPTEPMGYVIQKMPGQAPHIRMYKDVEPGCSLSHCITRVKGDISQARRNIGKHCAV